VGRPREHDEDTRDQLLEAAGRILHEQGAQALSVRGLADEVGTTTRAIYTLFGSKQELLRSLYRGGFENLYRQQSAVPITGDPEADLVALAHAYRSTALENRRLYSLMFDAMPGYDPAPEDREFARQTLVQVRDAVRAGVGSGRLPNDVRGITLQVWALVHGLATLELQGLLGDADSAKRYWTDAATALVRGYGQPGSSLRTDRASSQVRPRPASATRARRGSGAN
jgi:AcrR family transcriptional regulator